MLGCDMIESTLKIARSCPLVIQGFSKKGCLSDYGKTHVNDLLRCGEYYGL